MGIGISRTTELSSSQRTLSALRANQNRGEELRQQVTTGRKINTPSDSPTGAVAAMRLRTDLAAGERYTRSAADGTARLGTAENALLGVSNYLNQARDLVVQGLNATASDPTARVALAGQIESLRDAALSAANTSYLGRPVFGGTTANSRAFDDSGAYLGDDGEVLRRVDARTQVRVDVPSTVFGTGTDSVFSVLSTVASKLRSGDPTLNTELDRVDSRLSSVNTELAAVGSRYSRLTTAVDVAKDRAVTLTGQLSDIEEVDLTEAVVSLQTQSTAYQAALAATARIQQPSLLDFLR